ncbi:unnamed protein product [Closterium sp. NIES-54]
MDSGKYVRSDLDRDCAGAPAESSAAAANGVARPDLHSTFGPVLRENTASSTRHHASPLKQQQQHQQEQEEEDDISSFKDSDSLLLKDGSPITDSTHSSHNLKLSSWPFSSNSLISRVFRSPTVLLLLSLIFLLVGLYTLFLQPDSRLSSDTVDLSITSANELLPGQTQDPSPWTQEPGLPFTTSQKHNAADPEPHSDPESDPSHHGPDTVVANFHAAVEKGSFGSEGERGSLSGGESGTWRGKLVWTPQPNRFLLAVCLRGQVRRGREGDWVIIGMAVRWEATENSYALLQKNACIPVTRHAHLPVFSPRSSLPHIPPPRPPTSLPSRSAQVNNHIAFPLVSASAALCASSTAPLWSRFPSPLLPFPPSGEQPHWLSLPPPRPGSPPQPHAARPPRAPLHLPRLLQARPLRLPLPLRPSPPHLGPRPHAHVSGRRHRPAHGRVCRPVRPPARGASHAVLARAGGDVSNELSWAAEELLGE